MVMGCLEVCSGIDYECFKCNTTNSNEYARLHMNNDGQYAGKVCVGLNDIKKTENNRKPFVEAFAFSSISKHLKSEQYRFAAAFACTSNHKQG